MKEITVERFTEDPRGFLREAQEERLLVTQGGKPLALLVGLDNKDQEDWDLEASSDFWRMIEDRRARPTVALQEIEASLLADE